MSIWVLKSFHAINVLNVFILKTLNDALIFWTTTKLTLKTQR